MKIKKKKCVAASAFGIAALASLVLSNPSQSQDQSGSHVAISNEEFSHIHSLVIRSVDVAALISQFQNDTDAIQFESSSGFYQGVPTGTPHTHNVVLTKQDLVNLQNNGELSVQSDTQLGHSHLFQFVRQEECPVVMQPIPPGPPAPRPSPTPPRPSPSISPSPSPSPSVSPTPSPTVSITPSPTVTVTPTITPTVTPTLTPTGTPTPLPTFTILPIPPRPPTPPVVPTPPVFTPVAAP